MKLTEAVDNLELATKARADAYAEEHRAARLLMDLQKEFDGAVSTVKEQHTPYGSHWYNTRPQRR